MEIISNADEVENSYRQILFDSDLRKLSGFRIRDSIGVFFTHRDSQHFYVPQGNPIITKLISLGLERIKANRPHFIFAFYLEPYAICAWILSQMTGIPYVVRHAGSDLGRLLESSALSLAYKRVLVDALAVLSSDRHHQLFESIGVRRDALLPMASQRTPGDLFFPAPLPPLEPLLLGSYGKVGPSKGTLQLIDALAILREQGAKFSFAAHWGGRRIDDVLLAISKRGLERDFVQVMPFIPPWRIPDFIRSRHVLFFLESNFFIDYHSPVIPLEVNACGRYLITTNEIATKSEFKEVLVAGSNCSVLDKVNPESIVAAISEAHGVVKVGIIEPTFDASVQSVIDHRAVEHVFGDIETLATERQGIRS